MRLVFRHILPNCLAPVMVNATLDFGFVTLSAAGLSFIGPRRAAPVRRMGRHVESESRDFTRSLVGNHVSGIRDLVHRVRI